MPISRKRRVTSWTEGEIAQQAAISAADVARAARQWRKDTDAAAAELLDATSEQTSDRLPPLLPDV